MRRRDVQANRAERSRLLDEMEHITELQRKSLIRLIKDDAQRNARPRQRGRVYGYDRKTCSLSDAGAPPGFPG